VWPASAKALAVMRPKPDEAPVTRMMDLDMMKLLV
jgi:hypothetical protein